MKNGIMCHAKNDCLIFIKFGGIKLVEAQESSYDNNRVDFPRAKPGTYFMYDIVPVRMGCCTDL
jgi:hypothetical protein